MKTSVYTRHNCDLRKLTDIVRAMQQKGYISGSRGATSGSGDIVYYLRDPKTNFLLEYCVKTVENVNYVNWARVTAPENIIERFTTAVEYATSTTTQSIPTL